MQVFPGNHDWLLPRIKKGDPVCPDRLVLEERETGVGPATSTLARSRSTTELFPHAVDPNPFPVSRIRGCERRDLNPHAARHQILSLACLPFHHSRPTRRKSTRSPRMVAGRRPRCQELRPRTPCSERQFFTLEPTGRRFRRPVRSYFEPRRHRTCDPQIKSLLLCQLS